MRPIAVSRLRSGRRARALVVGGATAAIVVAANASQGAYFSQSWGWVALAFLVPTTVLLILGRVTVPGSLRIAFLASMGALAVWIALSAAWSISSAGSVREVERMLVYVSVALALAFVARRSDAPSLAAGALVGIGVTCTYSVVHWLEVDRFGRYDDPTAEGHLSVPLGYTNSLGLLAVMGMLLGIGFTSRSTRVHVRALAGAAFPVFALTIHLTYSRGAWASLAVGLVALGALETARVRLIGSILLVIPGCLIVLSAGSDRVFLGRWVFGGDSPAVTIGIGAVLSAVLVTATPLLAVRLKRLRWLSVVTAALLVAVGALVLASREASVLSGLRVVEAYTRVFTGSELDARDDPTTGRAEETWVALRSARESPLVGNGAGTYEYSWYENRMTDRSLRDAHNLYAETLGEVGSIGLLLLLAVLAIPLVAAMRGRRHRFVASSGGSYVAWMLGSAFDWHWEMVGVTMSAILAGGICLVTADRGRRRPLAPLAQLGLVSIGVALSLFAVVSLVGNQALFAGREALSREEWAAARDHAERADALLVWSYEPEVVLGDAYAGLGDRDAALRSYRDAVGEDPRNWTAWLRLAQVASGEERAQAYAKVRKLNPREGALPGEDESATG